MSTQNSKSHADHSKRGESVSSPPSQLAASADIATWQARMRAAVLNTVDETVVRDVLLAVVERAKSGDIQAARMVLSYAVGNPPKDDRAEGPTRAKPGSRAKLDTLAYRHLNGTPLHHPDDARFVDTNGTDD